MKLSVAGGSIDVCVSRLYALEVRAEWIGFSKNDNEVPRE